MMKQRTISTSMMLNKAPDWEDAEKLAKGNTNWSAQLGWAPIGIVPQYRPARLRLTVYETTPEGRS
jgi:hypothetical protein